MYGNLFWSGSSSPIRPHGLRLTYSICYHGYPSLESTPSPKSPPVRGSINMRTSKITAKRACSISTYLSTGLAVSSFYLLVLCCLVSACDCLCALAIMPLSSDDDCHLWLFFVFIYVSSNRRCSSCTPRKIAGCLRRNMYSGLSAQSG